MKIRAILLMLEQPVLPGKGEDEEVNGPEWFRDPTRKIRFLIVGYRYTVQPNLPCLRITPDYEGLIAYMREQGPGLFEEEILIVTDQKDALIIEGHDLAGANSKMHVMRVGPRVYISQIIGEILRIEHAKIQ